MLRKGDGNLILKGIAFAFATGIVILIHVYGGLLRQDMEASANEFTSSGGQAEQMLSAPCATKSRAVFYNASIVSGDFDCITPMNPIYVSFGVDTDEDGESEQTHEWTIRSDPTQDEPQIIDRFPDAAEVHRYEVLVYDEQDDETHKAIMRIGGPR